MLDLIDGEKIFETEVERACFEIIGKIDKLRIAHESFSTALTEINRCLKQSVYSREAVNCMLIGEGGSGKTSIGKIFEAQFPPLVIRENDLEISTVPVFYTSFKSAGNLDALATDMLEKLGDPNPHSGLVGNKTSRVLKLLITCRTRILFIDELHDIEDLRDNKLEFIKWIKEIANECGPVVCLMGVKDCESLFNGNKEMARRFKKKIYLQTLSVGTKDKLGQLPKFLNSICKAIMKVAPINSFPPLGSYENSLRVWASTNGNVDFIMSMLKGAVSRALLNNREEVTIEDLSNVWESGLLNDSSRVKFNPFTAALGDLSKSIKTASLK